MVNKVQVLSGEQLAQHVVPDERNVNGEGFPVISVVIPIYNEEDNLPPLYQSLQRELEKLGQPWEIVFVDDDSRDGSFGVLNSISAQDHRVSVVRLRRNFGQTAALTAGFDHAEGQVIITMDGDLQNDPADIARLLAKLDEGYDIVSGWRKNRRDPFLSKRAPSLVSNRLASWLTGVPLHDYGCTLKAYRRDVLERVHLYGELHRYIPAVASAVGAKVAEIPVTHHPRRHGKSKYRFTRLVRGLLDLISLKLMLSYMTRPMQIFGSLGLLLFALGGASALATVLMKLLMGMDITGNPLLYIAMFCWIAAIQFIGLGFLGEINIRTYHEAQRKPIYAVRQVIGKVRKVAV